MEIDRGDIDPRLREPLTPSYSILPPPPPSSYSHNHIRLPPPPQQQQQHPQPQPHPTLPSWSQDGHLPYYSDRTESQPHALPPPDLHPPPHSNFAPAHPPDGNSTEPKRPRACEACRSLKVKCDPDTANGSCRRCAKAGRSCIVTAPSRKRQKKTDSRVAELERKINALEATLHAKGDGSSGSEHEEGYDADTSRTQSMKPQATRNDHMQRTLNHSLEARGEHQGHQGLQSTSMEARKQDAEASPQPPNSLKRRLSDYHEEDTNMAISESRKGPVARRRSKKAPVTGSIHPQLVAGTSKSGASSSILADSTAYHEYADVIDKKILDAESAAKIFSFYTQHMAPHMPIVVFPSNVTAGIIRKTKPTLFLAILSIASVEEYPHLQGTLAREIMRVYTDRLISKREQSLELIQALQVSTTWYSQDADFYQLIHIAAVMGIELGMSTRVKSNKERFFELWKGDSRAQSGLEAKDSIESKRAWLGCYFLCAK